MNAEQNFAGASQREVETSAWSFTASSLVGILLAGAFSGALVGLLARLAMRGVVLLLGGRPEFTLVGTMGIVVLFILLGLITAVLYLAVLRWLPANAGKRTLLLSAGLLLLTMPFFWLRLFDRITSRNRNTDAANGVYFLGRKSHIPLTPNEIVQYYHDMREKSGAGSRQPAIGIREPAVARGE